MVGRKRLFGNELPRCCWRQELLGPGYYRQLQVGTERERELDEHSNRSKQLRRGRKKMYLAMSNW